MKKEKILQIEEISDSAAVNLSLDTIKISKQALVFVNTKRSAEKTAEDIAKKIKLRDAEIFELTRISEEAYNVLSQPTKQCERLADCLKKGVAFHHAGLTHKQKEIIEDNFKAGKIKIISCTPTLAAGLDLPAFRAILKDLKRYSHRGMAYIPVLEYLQMCGRAGRPKYDVYGEAISVAGSESEKNEIIDRYIYGVPESITSKLAVEPVLRTYLLSLIATEFVDDKKSIQNFFEKTFWAYQFKDMEELDKIISKMLALLEKWEFIVGFAEKKDFVSADELSSGKIKATLMGKRAAELYIDPYTARFFLDCSLKISKRKIPAFAFLQVISHTLEMRPLLAIRSKEMDEVEEKLNQFSADLLESEPSIYDSEYDDFLRSIKTALFFNDWIEEKDEEYLLEKYNVRPGETRAKLDIADWLLYCIEELLKVAQNRKMLSEIEKIRIRIKYGVKEELIPLLRFKNIGRVRARKLYGNKIRNLKEVKDVDIVKLTQLLGKNVAIDLKKQVGIDHDNVEKKSGFGNLKDYTS